MTATSFSEVKRKLGEFWDRAVNQREPVLVQRRGGEAIVILAAEDYESLVETAYLLASPENAARLLAALASARRGSTEPMSLEDLRAAVGL
jgi:antitoxin YefM